MFILAQISGFIAWLLMLLSYYRKNTNKILIVQVLSIVFYLLNYLFLGAWTGLFIIFLELVRDFLYYKTDKDDLIFIITIPIYIILFILSFGNLIEIIPIIASLFEGFTLTKKKTIVVPGAIIVYSMWVIYDISVKAYSGALTDGLIVFSNIFILYNMIRGYKELDKFKISSRYSITKYTLDKINKLKKDIYAEEILLSDSYEYKLYKKNTDFLKFIKYKDELKGYFTTIRINKNTFNDIINIDTIRNEYENIILSSNNNGKILLLDSIVLNEKYQNNKSVELITKNISRFQKNKIYNEILILASTEFETQIAKKLGYKPIKKFEDNTTLFSK